MVVKEAILEIFNRGYSFQTETFNFYQSTSGIILVLKSYANGNQFLTKNFSIEEQINSLYLQGKIYLEEFTDEESFNKNIIDFCLMSNFLIDLMIVYFRNNFNKNNKTRIIECLNFIISFESKKDDFLEKIISSTTKHNARTSLR